MPMLWRMNLNLRKKILVMMMFGEFLKILRTVFVRLADNLCNAGVGFFVTTFNLAFPGNTDVLISFQFETTNTQPYRAFLFVNGWKFGKVSLCIPALH